MIIRVENTKEALEKLWDCYVDSPDEQALYYYDLIKQSLERLEKLEKIFSDSHICEIKAKFNEIECNADKCDNCPLGIGDGICLKNTFEKKWELQQENQELKSKCKAIPPLAIQNEKLVKIIKDYCYIDNFPEGEVIRMCCESYEESNREDFEFLKEVLE